MNAGYTGWIPDVPNRPNAVGEELLEEIATYLNRVGGGTEFRSNSELEQRFYHDDGTLNTVALASAKDVYHIVTPSWERALMLNKAYKAIVEEQDFIFGRDATVTPPPRVLELVDNETSPALPPERQFDWNILLDWSKADAACRFSGDVDFAPLSGPHRIQRGGTHASQHDRVCTAGTANLTGDLVITLADDYLPQPGNFKI